MRSALTDGTSVGKHKWLLLPGLTDATAMLNTGFRTDRTRRWCLCTWQFILRQVSPGYSCGLFAGGYQSAYLLTAPRQQGCPSAPGWVCSCFCETLHVYLAQAPKGKHQAHTRLCVHPFPQKVSLIAALEMYVEHAAKEKASVSMSWPGRAQRERGGRHVPESLVWLSPAQADSLQFLPEPISSNTRAQHQQATEAAPTLV